MSATATSLRSPGAGRRLVRRDVPMRALGQAPRFAVIPEWNNMSSLERVVRQATQLPLLSRMVVVPCEEDQTWLQRKIGFKNRRNVNYHLAAARWARLSASRPQDRLAVDGFAATWPARVGYAGQGHPVSLDEATDAQQRLPLKEDV